MTSSPMPPSLNISTVEFLDHYVDCLENFPLDVQRYVSQVREYDLLYHMKLDQIGHLLSLYRSEQTGPGKRKLLTKIQKYLIKSQHYGDEKLNLISQIVDLVENRSQQIDRDTHMLEMGGNEDNVNKNTNGNSTNKVKVEKTTKPAPEKSKNIYEKPKRIRRVTRVNDKHSDKNDKNTTGLRYNSKNDIEENEEELIEEDEETENVKPKKEIKKNKEKDKTREKVKDEKEEKKDEKKNDKNHKGKVTKKITKVKKKKKKEKEPSVEDMAVDPDEPTYCICNSISYGDMIGCDNDDCQIEWFHFGCVNLTHKPKGKWYCPSCTIERRERKK